MEDEALTENPPSHIDEEHALVNFLPGTDIKSATQYARLPDDISSAAMDEINRRLENGIIDETYGGHHMMNRNLIEHAALLDLSFRYYYGGGETAKINEHDYGRALKSQSQFMQALRDHRRSVRQDRNDPMKYEEHRAKMNRNMLKNRTLGKNISENQERNKRPGEALEKFVKDHVLKNGKHNEM